MEIELRNVSVDIPIFNSQGRSLKKTVIGFATGGKIGLTESGKTIVRCLDNVSFTAKSRERIGLIGHNGAGKSTLLRVLGKVYTPTKGYAKIQGKVGSLIDISLGIDGEATGLENVFLRAALLGIPKKQVEQELDDIISFTQLGPFINMPVRTYSTGMHMRLAFAVSTMITPDILLMDEWLSVGDQEFQRLAEMRLNSLIERSNILFIASHSRKLIENCCTRVIWLENGRIVMDDDPLKVCSSYFC
ncbi:ABC transporter ATP-binding protein [Parasutterella muris]|uniref:ABC transporter ATP-binding protein n=1 Tax=Parasutterella muris TaxID=2565572 RepID=UPI00203A8121|nr:ABC transporter ATP-binding protein [Parasutterella muris]